MKPLLKVYGAIFLFITVPQSVFCKIPIDPSVKVDVTEVTGNPYLKKLTITINASSEDSLGSLILSFDDRSCGVNTTTSLFNNGKFAGSVTQTIISAKGIKRYIFKYNLPPFIIGRNKLTATAIVKHNNVRIQKVGIKIFDYILPAYSRYLTDNGKIIQFEGIPIFANITNNNVIDIFKDADQDGLLDSWENFVLDAVRPYLKFNIDEELLKHPDHNVLIFSRVSPYQDNKNSTDRYIVINSVIAFSKDYGDPGLHAGSHNGDTQNYITFWKIIGNDKIALYKIQAVRHTKMKVHADGSFPVHPDDIMTQFYPGDQEFALSHPMLYLEEDKHGVWPNATLCFENSAFDCYQERQGGVSVPRYAVMLNVGEPKRSGQPGLPFIDILNDIRSDGPHKEAYNIFKGERIWTNDAFHAGLGDDHSSVGSIGNFVSNPEQPVFETNGNRVNPVLINVQIPDVEITEVTFR